MEDTQQVCNHCQNPIYDEDWLRCPFCGEQLDVDAGFISSFTKGPLRYVGIVITLMVLYCFVWLML